MDDLIKRLAEAWGPPGFEHHVRDLIRAEVAPLCDSIRVDPLGNLIGQIGSGPTRIMTAAHMDEIGVIVSHIDRQGYARFSNLGGLLHGSLIGARVRFENGVIGTIAAEHPLTRRRDLPDLDGFFIDFSAGPDEYAPVKVGDPAGFVGEVIWRGNRVIGKALDDRLGCAIQIETMRRVRQLGTPHSLFFVFTVQEEVGSRGAAPAAYSVEPHLAFAIDGSVAGDQPNGEKLAVRLGAGVSIKTRDVGHVVPPAVKDLIVRRAEEAGLPYQFEVLNIGSTDGALIQLARSGVPTGAVLFPFRYFHTRSETADRGDIETTIRLLTALLTQPVEW